MNRNLLSYCLALVGVFLVFFILSYCSSFDAEDLFHMQAWNLREGLACATSSYESWNSRIGELAAYAMLPYRGLGSYYLQFLYYVVNPIACVGALFLCIRIGTGQWHVGRNIFVFLFAFLCFSGSKQNWLWFIGNMNWFYPCLLAMVFFVLWEGVFHGKFKVSAWKFLLSVPLAVIVGMSNENTSIVSLLLFIGCGVYAGIRQRKFCVTWQYAVIAVLLSASAVIFYTAPCCEVRAASSEWELSFHNIVFNSLLGGTNWMYLGLFYWREILVAVLMLFIGRRRGVKFLDKRMACLLVVAVMLWGVLLAAPCWGAPRAFTPLDMVLFAIMVRMFCKIVGHDGACARMRVPGVVMAVRVLLTMTVLVPTMASAFAQYRVRSQIAQLAEAALQRGETRLVLHKGDLDTSAAMPRYFHIPGCVVAHDLQPFVPLIRISKTEYENAVDFRHREIFPHDVNGFVSCGDGVLNRGVAKRFGLEDIIFVVD